ncbi:hypothetical protein WA158_000149 [Blastocystis sp. Blastoise]
MTDTRNNTFISSFINDDFEVLNGSGLTLDESILDEMESKLIIDCNEDNILTSKSDNIIIINSTIENGRDTSKDKNAKTDTAGNDGFRDLDIPNGFNNPTNTMNIHEHVSPIKQLKIRYSNGKICPLFKTKESHGVKRILCALCLNDDLYTAWINGNNTNQGFKFNSSNYSLRYHAEHKHNIRINDPVSTFDTEYTKTIDTKSKETCIVMLLCTIAFSDLPFQFVKSEPLSILLKDSIYIPTYRELKYGLNVLSNYIFDSLKKYFKLSHIRSIILVHDAVTTTNTIHFFSIYAFWYNTKTMKYEQCMLKMISESNGSSSEDIAVQLIDVIKKYEIQEKIFGFVSDSASSNVKCSNTIGTIAKHMNVNIKYKKDYCYMFSFINTLFGEHYSVIDQLNSIYCRINHSYTLLKKYQTITGSTKKFHTYVKTRFNSLDNLLESSYILLNSMDKLQLSSIINRNEISEYDIQVIHLLHPFINSCSKISNILASDSTGVAYFALELVRIYFNLQSMGSSVEELEELMIPSTKDYPDDFKLLTDLSPLLCYFDEKYNLKENALEDILNKKSINMETVQDKENNKDSDYEYIIDEINDTNYDSTNNEDDYDYSDSEPCTIEEEENTDKIYEEMKRTSCESTEENNPNDDIYSPFHGIYNFNLAKVKSMNLIKKYLERMKSIIFATIILDPSIDKKKTLCLFTKVCPLDLEYEFIKLISYLQNNYKLDTYDLKIYDNSSSCFLYDTFRVSPSYYTLLSQYLGIPLVIKPIIQWWSDNCSYYPGLSDFAVSLLSIKPSSISIERSFSKVRRIISYGRSNLKPKTVEQLLILKEVQNKFEFSEYSQLINGYTAYYKKM